jgi:maleylpyruvate isomerase
MDDGTKLFLGTLAAIGDGDLDRPIALPGWTGRHLVAHDLPPAFVADLLADVVRKRAGGGEGPGLAAWLTGRTPQPPQLGAWL